MSQTNNPKKLRMSRNEAATHHEFTQYQFGSTGRRLARRVHLGVLDALLEDGRVALEGIGGASTGAMNAVALAHGRAGGAQYGENQTGLSG